MQAVDFENYTEQLRASLQSRRDVVGLIVLGSTADTNLRDEWSDHDFWVITKAGAQDTFVNDLSWLPDYENIAITVSHGRNRRTILFHNRHKVEFAIFDANDMRSGKVERYRVLIDRDGIGKSVAAVHDETLEQAQTRPDALENLCVLLWSACERYCRGELLSARQYVDGFAINQLLNLVSAAETLQEGKDALDPRRRLELTSPGLAAELLETLQKPVPETALSLLQILERELKPKAPTLAWDKVAMVQRWIAEIAR